LVGVAECLGKLDTEVVAAMSQVKIRDVEAWTREQIGTTGLSRRRQALRSWRKKKSSKNPYKNQILHKNRLEFIQRKPLGFNEMTANLSQASTWLSSFKYIALKRSSAPHLKKSNFFIYLSSNDLWLVLNTIIIFVRNLFIP
jgi:hypothetical protein